MLCSSSVEEMTGDDKGPEVLSASTYLLTWHLIPSVSWNVLSTLRYDPPGWLRNLYNQLLIRGVLKKKSWAISLTWHRDGGHRPALESGGVKAAGASPVCRPQAGSAASSAGAQPGWGQVFQSRGQGESDLLWERAPLLRRFSPVLACFFTSVLQATISTDLFSTSFLD